jgi:dTDP-4-dehydrorhamnose reductase
VIQIATDCVYSGSRGGYSETDVHDALDVYGKTKSLGEVRSSNVHHLRCSIVGPEPKDHKFLLDWVSRQPRSAELKGFTNHDWNGVTTLHFARIAVGVIKTNMELPHVHHVCPANRMTKAEMLSAIAVAYDRSDIRIENIKAPTKIDRTLITNDRAMNQRIWSAAGYGTPPTIGGMIDEIAQITLLESVVRIA